MNGDKCGGGNINIGFIGAGAVGCSMGKYLCENSSIAKIKGYYSRTSKSVDIAATFTNSKAYASPEELVNECDVICITTPDDIILKVWSRLKIIICTKKSYVILAVHYHLIYFQE